MLDELRMEIDRLDDELLRIVARRMEIARRIGEVKAARGASPRDEDREAVVKGRWASMAADLGLPQGLVDDLLNAIMRESIRQQLPPVEGVVTIVGSGRVASSLRSLMRGRIYLTDFFGSPEVDPCDAFMESDYIIIATRPSILGNTAFQDSLRCASGRVVSDVFSVKGRFFRELEGLSMRLGFNYVSIHPLFTSPERVGDETIVVTPSVTSGAALEFVSRLWRSLGFRVVISGADAHDRAMAVTQVIHHLYLAALRRALEEASLSLGIDYSQFVTHSLKSTLAVAERVLSQDVVMEIQSNNEYAPIARRAGLEAMIRTANDLGGVS
ncbi:MAG: chorismate mutase [Thermocladium sp.]